MNPLFASLHGDMEIGRIFSVEGFVERCLQFERSLARIQGELGEIPRSAADEVQRVATLAHIDLDLLQKRTAQVGLPIVGLVEQIVAKSRDDLGQYVHFGATTQDVMDSAVVLQMKDALAHIEQVLQNIASRLSHLAEREGATVLAGRTNHQHALPVTFGFKAAVWNSSVRRHLERLSQMKPRLFVAQFGGAVGTLASLPKHGPETRARLARALDLAEPEIAWHCARDTTAEAVGYLAQLGATLGKIGCDVLAMSQTEVGEVSHSASGPTGASSTMPQKRNPIAASSVVALSRLLFDQVPMMLNASLQQHERSLDAWYIELHALPQSFLIAGGMLKHAESMLNELRVEATQMSRNLEITNGAIASESLQMELARRIGLKRAHDAISEACAAAARDRCTLAEAIAAMPVVSESMTAVEVDELLGTDRHAVFAMREIAMAKRPDS